MSGSIAVYMHYGNGTQEMVESAELEEQVENLTFARWFCTRDQGEQYLERLAQEVQRFRDFDLVLYQAGADVHVDDPLGGVLTTAQMRTRDRIVFQAAKAAGVAIAWNLAGGYQQPVSKVVDLHVQTMRECVAAYLTPDSVQDS